MEKAPVTVATGALGPLIDKLAALLGSEYKLRRRTRSDIKIIKSKLKFMHSLLWTIWERGLLDVASKELKVEALDLADDMEDVVDDFIIIMKRSPSNKCFVQTKVKASPFKDFKERVNDVSRRCRGMWKKKKIAQPISAPRAHPLDHNDGSNLVGLNHHSDRLIKYLLKEEEPQLKMASLTGMAGMGKTTLARVVYEEIGNIFQVRAFVSVTSNPNIKEVIVSILQQVAADSSIALAGTEAATEEHLVHIISKFLGDKRYLVIIDDVWCCAVWEMIKKCFPENNLGSRIFMTTRIDSIAGDDFGNWVYKLNPVWGCGEVKLVYGPGEEIFSRMKSDSLWEWLDSDHPLVQMCGQVPFALLCLYSAFVKEREHQEQQGACVTTRDLPARVGEQVRTNGIQNTPGFEPLVESLQLSFDDLPHHMLKTCLLYCSIFPENHPFERDYLVRLWIGERFVCTKEAADGHFDELVKRALILPLRGSDNEGRIWSYAMHPIMRFFLRWKLHGENFFTCSSDIPASYTCRIRRLYVDNSGLKQMDHLSGLDWSHIRSLLVYQGEEIIPFKKLARLRLLDIDKTFVRLNWTHLVDICGLVSLKHLSGLRGYQQLETLEISYTQISELPAEIGRLQQLETLDISYAAISELPKEIWSLQQLETLNMSGSNISEIAREIEDLHQLKTLDISGNEYIEKLPKEIVGLHQLENLNISRTWISELPNDIGSLQRLKTLDISHSNVKKLPKEVGRLQNLEQLLLTGAPVDNIPREIGRLKKLKILELDGNVVTLPLEFSQLLELVALPEYLHRAFNKNDLHQAFNKNDLVSLLEGQLLSFKIVYENKVGLVIGSKHIHVPGWVRDHFNDVAMLDIRICKLEEEDLKILRVMPNLQGLVLRFDVLPKNMISITGGGFQRLKNLRVDSRVPRIKFLEGAMPMLDTLYFDFKFFGGPPNKDPLGIKHLASLSSIYFQCNQDWYRPDRPCISATIEVVRKEAREHPNYMEFFVPGRTCEKFQGYNSIQISEDMNEASSSGTKEIQD